MKSYTADKTDLEELLAEAELEDRKFVAEKQNVVIISSTAMNIQQEHDIERQRQLKWNILTIPKRYLLHCSILKVSFLTNLIDLRGQRKQQLRN